MEVFDPERLPVVLAAAGAEIRALDLDGMTVAFYRLPAGMDARRLLAGLPGGACHCPHWGLVLSGRLRIHTKEGSREVAAGEMFHVGPGHAPETLEPTEMFEVSPSAEAGEVWQHLQKQLAALATAG